jgi:hypothetical protein
MKASESTSLAINIKDNLDCSKYPLGSPCPSNCPRHYNIRTTSCRTKEHRANSIYIYGLGQKAVSSKGTYSSGECHHTLEPSCYK